MQNTSSAQASPDITPEDYLNVTAGRILEGKGGNCCLDTSACPLNGIILASGGAYGEMSGKM
jgi:hypothetical protein